MGWKGWRGGGKGEVGDERIVGVSWGIWKDF